MDKEDFEKQITVRVTEEMHDKLNDLSDRRGVSVAEIVRDVLHAYLIRQF